MGLRKLPEDKKWTKGRTDCASVAWQTFLSLSLFVTFSRFNCTTWSAVDHGGSVFSLKWESVLPCCANGVGALCKEILRYHASTKDFKGNHCLSLRYSRLSLHFLSCNARVLLGKSRILYGSLCGMGTCLFPCSYLLVAMVLLQCACLTGVLWWGWLQGTAHGWQFEPRTFCEMIYVMVIVKNGHASAFV